MDIPTNKPVVFAKPNPVIFNKQIIARKTHSIKFTNEKIYGLSDFIKNQAIKKAHNKTLLDLMEDEKTQIKKQIEKFTTENIISFGIVGLGILAFYYSGYKIPFIPLQ